MLRIVEFDRSPAGDALDGLVEWFWSVSWALPDDVVHDQQVLNHPAGNISIGTLDDTGVRLDPAQGRVYGVQRGLSHRRLAGSGWTVAARTTVGGLGALLDAPARSVENAERPLDALAGLAADALVVRVRDLAHNDERVEQLRSALSDMIEQRNPAMVAEARDVVSMTALAERDRTVCTVEQLARRSGVSVRSLQRLFDIHVGASPSFVIRRWRIIEAAEAASKAAADDQPWRGWAEVAAELAYSDQAHLSRDFQLHLGVSPSAYVARNRPSD